MPLLDVIKQWTKYKIDKQLGERFLAIHTSGTPPTRVLTVNNPQLAASNIAMQKASVKELPVGLNHIR